MVNKFFNREPGVPENRRREGQPRSANVGTLFINCKDSNFFGAWQSY